MDYILLFLTGILTSITIAIPGVDYAILLLALGYYHPLIQTIMGLIFFQNVLHNLGILIIYGVGYLVGLLIFSKFMKFLINRYQKQTAFAGFAYVLIAPFLLVQTCVNNNRNFDFNYW
jgi:putative membrane protein